jgi:hypothetical protein
MAWQPIETAPRDGTSIIGWAVEPLVRDTRAIELAWNDGLGVMTPGWYDLYDHYGPHEPTHWLPMPELPEDR